MENNALSNPFKGKHWNTQNNWCSLFVFHTCSLWFLLFLACSLVFGFVGRGWTPCSPSGVTTGWQSSWEVAGRFWEALGRFLGDCWEGKLPGVCLEIPGGFLGGSWGTFVAAAAAFECSRRRVGGPPPQTNIASQ